MQFLIIEKKKLTIKIHFYIRVTPINALAGLSLSN